MKKVHLLKTMRTVLQTVPVVFAGLLLASCAQDGFDNDEKWESSVSDTQMVSPTASTVEIAPDATGNYQIVSWPVVLGASGYECRLVDVTDPAKQKTLFSEVVDGCSFKAPREDDCVYEVYIKTLGNKEKNNADAKETTKLEYNTIIKTQETITSGTDLTTWFKDKALPENEKDAVTKQLIPLAYDLEANGNYTMSGTIDFGFRKIMIRTQKKKADGSIVKASENAIITLQGAPEPAEGEESTETAGKTCFLLQHGFTLKNVNVDCTSMTGEALLLMHAADGISDKVRFNHDVYPYAGDKNIYLLEEPIEVRNCMIKNLKKALLGTNATKWGLTSLNIINNIIQLDNCSKNVLNFNYKDVNSAAPKNLLVQNNTIYDLDGTNQVYFIQLGHKTSCYKIFAPNQDAPKNTLVYEISNNTFIQTFRKQYFGNNVAANKCVRNILKDNIFIDVWLVTKYALSLQDRTISNCYQWMIKGWGDNNVTTQPNDDKEGGLIFEDPGITEPTTALDLTKENGGLTGLTPSGGALSNKAGDPRWLPTE